MKKASEYRVHAQECRALAVGLKEGEQRDQLLEMARTWERLAEDRASLVARHPELALPGETSEEGGTDGNRSDGMRPISSTPKTVGDP